MSNLKVGTVQKIGNRNYIILDIQDDNVICITENFVYENIIFDEDSNDFAQSSILKKLNTEFLSELEESVGKENIEEQVIDLTAMNGSPEYSSIKCKVGLITYDKSRKYHNILKQYQRNLNDWEFTATPWATPNDGYLKYSVCCLLPYGLVHYFNCDGDRGVRAFCIFKSNIFES